MHRFLFAPVLLVSAFAVTGAALAAPVTYKLDPNHTLVLAQWNHFGFSNPVASFGQADGILVYDATDVAASSVQVTLPLAGLEAFVPKFNEHLRSADFFDAAKYPQITFRSTKVKAAGKNKLKVTGDLTVRNITRPVVLDVRLNKAGQHAMAKRAAIGFDATATLKRSDFGVAKFAPGVSDQVTLRITTEAMAPMPAAAPAK